LGLEAHLLALCQRSEGSVEEDRESVDAGPRRVLDVRATGGRQDSSFDEVVEGRLQTNTGSTLRRVASLCRAVASRFGT
jgi:hypothetical protein